MARYEVLGRPLDVRRWPPEISGEDLKQGTEIELTLSQEREAALVGEGILARLSKPYTKREDTPEDKGEEKADAKKQSDPK